MLEPVGHLHLRTLRWTDTASDGAVIFEITEISNYLFMKMKTERYVRNVKVISNLTLVRIRVANLIIDRNMSERRKLVLKIIGRSSIAKANPEL